MYVCVDGREGGERREGEKARKVVKKRKESKKRETTQHFWTLDIDARIALTHTMRQCNAWTIALHRKQLPNKRTKRAGWVGVESIVHLKSTETSIPLCHTSYCCPQNIKTSASMLQGTKVMRERTGGRDVQKSTTKIK